MELVKRYDGMTPQAGIERFCQFTGLSHEEFWKTAWAFTNKLLFERDEAGIPRLKVSMH